MLIFASWYSDIKMQNDKEILGLLEKDITRGMDSLFNRYYRPLVVFAHSYLNDLAEAEDVVQEQMVKLWTCHAFDRVAADALGTFLFTVAKNACINRLEKKQLPLTSLDLPHFRIAQEEAGKMDDTAARIVFEALQKLPEKTRWVVECVMLEDKMYKEAASELGVSVNTVKTLLKQGMKVLKVELKDKQEYLLFLYIRARLN